MSRGCRACGPSAAFNFSANANAPAGGGAYPERFAIDGAGKLAAQQSFLDGKSEE